MNYLEYIYKLVDIQHINILFILGIILFGGTIGGRLFQKIKFPQVVGYILIGILLGKTGAGFISSDLLVKLEPINFFALGLISFSLGGEIKLSLLKKHGKTLSYLLLFEVFGAFIVVSGVIFLIAQFFLPPGSAMVIALLLGAISSATAAAGTTDVLAEIKAKGLLTSTLFGIIALDDVLALFIFAVFASVSSIIIGINSNLLISVMKPVYEIGVSALLGISSGFILSRVLKKYEEEERIFVFVTGSIILVLGLSLIIKVDMLMAATIMGFTLSNRAPKKSKTIMLLIEKFAGPIYILFFVFVGAKIQLNELTPVLVLLILGFIVFRIIGKGVGIKLGGILSGAPEKIRKYLPLCLFSQSGVAIGLSIMAYQKFPGEIGETTLIVITTSTFVVQLIGPIFIKMGIVKAGENDLDISELDVLKNTKSSELIKNTKLDFISQNSNLSRIFSIFNISDLFSLPVVDDEKNLIGIINIENIKNSLNLFDLNNVILAVDIMSESKVSIDLNSSLLTAKNILKEHSLDAVPVLDENHKLAGIIEYNQINNFIKKQLLISQKKAGI